MKSTINLEVSYGQISVFASALKQPFNDWTEHDVARGFSWRPGSVSFRSVVEGGPHAVEINVADRVGDLHPDAVRAIEVPFEVPTDGGIEVGSISDTTHLSLPVGSYLLRCEFLRPANTGRERVRLVFGRKDVPRFAVLLDASREEMN